MNKITYAIEKTRQNHALEHATINILTQKGIGPLAGYSDWQSFYVYGNVNIEDLQAAVDEALERLKKGENQLAIHAHCGTNYAVTGLLAGTGAWLMLAGSNSWRKKFERFPLVILMVTLISILAQPLGPRVQKNYTTAPLAADFRISGIVNQNTLSQHSHRIFTAW